MDAILPYLLPLLLLPLSLYLVSIIRRKAPDDEENLPRGSNSWLAVFEENIKIALDPEKFVKGCMKKYSPKVFKTSLLGKKVAAFCGPEGNKFLSTNESKLLVLWMPPSMTDVLAPPEFIDNHLKGASPFRQVLLRGALSREALKRYVPVMDKLARAHLDRDWNPDSIVRVLPLSKKYTFELACRLFLSEVDPVRIKKLSDCYSALTKGMISTPINFPGTAYNHALKGSRIAHEEVIRMIQKRRKELIEMGIGEGEGRDFLSNMMLVKDEDGQFLSDNRICNHIIGLLVATYDTTSSAITNIFNYLAQLPHIYDEVLKEQMAIVESKGPGDILTWDDLEKMKYSWNVARESLRLMPPSLGAFRETTTDFTYAGFTIPKGWKTFWTPHSSHKSPDYFPEPEKFDPSRFEGRGPAPYTFVPFGVGPRTCPGQEYTRIELMVLMHNVVTRFRFDKAIPNEKMVFIPSPTPAQGLPLHLHPHPLNKCV